MSNTKNNKNQNKNSHQVVGVRAHTNGRKRRRLIVISLYHYSYIFYNRTNNKHLTIQNTNVTQMSSCKKFKFVKHLTLKTCLYLGDLKFYFSFVDKTRFERSFMQRYRRKA